jgi:methylated-DNA-[protein]-cysteine S-methyltransferase
MMSQVVAYRTPFGTAWILATGAEVCELGLPGSDRPIAPSVGIGAELADVVARLEGYWHGGGPLPAAAPLLHNQRLTPFARRVVDVVVAIPAGSTTTYAEVASAAGRPGAARAVGMINARNRLAPIVPCHRVVGSDGSLRGYAGGLGMKQALLKMEASLGD